VLALALYINNDNREVGFFSLLMAKKLEMLLTVDEKVEKTGKSFFCCSRLYFYCAWTAYKLFALSFVNEKAL
jgi:hypothetical protein